MSKFQDKFSKSCVNVLEYRNLQIYRKMIVYFRLIFKFRRSPRTENPIAAKNGEFENRNQNL